eukprot:TRINITY_DN321_c0_g1_i1.p1 TRINITY_DN321_c0_g1~~TRINITY_DN321_c0_g1_i1.p1  ORF type:complete len:253 (-),score=44.89 TRINITY_DN321_c0_g1_i1:579-1337(-)
MEQETAVITGASRGIGKAIAIKLAEKYNVVICARTDFILENVSDTINENVALNKCEWIVADVTKPDNMEKVAQLAINKFGRIDVVVNNAGVMMWQTLTNPKIEEWNTMIDINCKGVLNTLAAILPFFKKQNYGKVINITSDAGRQCCPYLTVYSATKHFVEAISKGLRHELRKTNIQVTSIQPGDVETDIGISTSDEAAYEECMKLEALDGDMTQILKPKDIAEAVWYVVNQPNHVSIAEMLVQPRGGFVCM